MSKAMSRKPKTKAIPSKSLAKGLLAGLIGGLIATAAKSMAEKLYPVLTHSESTAPALPAEGVASHELALRPTSRSKNSHWNNHWAVGALAGATYGVVAELYPPATAKDGAAFGITLATLKHDGTLPALGLAAHPGPQSTRERARDVTLHVVYGVVAENVRRAIRYILD